ncbi:MAG: restriction endonuclease [Firmicutes bacterium]|nr:restriction endonuclease [Bacillota bacterium]
MNYWTKVSTEFANQRNYLDELYKVYPITPNLRREISRDKEENIRNAFISGNNIDLIKQLLDLELFPIKDSYVAYLKRDRNAIERNPQTINRIAGNLYQMGFDQIIEKCTEPKETNRQIGPMFKQWIDKGTLGVPIFKKELDFLNCNENCVYNVSDAEMKNFAKKYLGFEREKGIDFIAKFNNKYIIAEAKFITDFGGHQNAQFDDAVRTMQSDFSNKIVENEVIPIAIMDGVLFIKGNNKLYTYIKNHDNQIIISSLLLREFLFSL